MCDRLFRIFILIVLPLLVIPRSTLAAQNTQLQPIYAGYVVQHLSWSTDSRSLVFNDGVVWQQYDLQTRRLSQSQTWPLQPQLTKAEKLLFKPQSFMFGSPNGRYIVYVGRCRPFPKGKVGGEGTTCESYIELLDRYQGKAFDVAVVGFVDYYNGSDDFSIFWNRQSSAFTITSRLTYGGGVWIGYVSLRKGLQSLTPADVLPLTIGNRSYTLVDDWLRFPVFDISDNGDVVLLHVSLNDTVDDQTIPQIALLNPLNPTQSQIIDLEGSKTVIGAAFKAGNEQKLLIADDRSLLEYDLTTGTSRVASDIISSTQARIAAFSPDRKWLALVNSKDGGSSTGARVYIFPVSG